MNPKDNILPAKNISEPMGLSIQPHSEDRLFPRLEEASELSVACYRADFSASRISHAVEDAEAHLLNLNVTSEVLDSGQIVVDLRISHRDAGAVSRSLERYGYTTLRIRQGGFDAMDQVAAERIGDLITRLNV